MTRINEDPSTIFTTKSASYYKFRWDYAAAAITDLLNMSAVTKKTAMADIGSGTGILTRHFLDQVRIVFAVEPNQAMRKVAEKRYGDRPVFRSIPQRAESTALSAGSLDLIVVGQALHWFDANQAPVEFSRILRPEGWLGVFWNGLGEGDLSQSLDKLFGRFGGGERRRTTSDLLPSYFQGADYQQLPYRVEHRSDWDQFIGGLLTASWAPETTGSAYEGFKEEARTVFDQFNSGGEISIEVITHVAIGQPNAKYNP